MCGEGREKVVPATLCPTYRRPKLLAELLGYWEAEDYPPELRRLFILDDGATFEAQVGSTWELHTTERRACWLKWWDPLAVAGISHTRLWTLRRQAVKQMHSLLPYASRCRPVGPWLPKYCKGDPSRSETHPLTDPRERRSGQFIQWLFCAEQTADCHRSYAPLSRKANVSGTFSDRQAVQNG